MSYDLTFWKQRPTCTASPSHIYGELLEGRVVDGLETIPTAEFIRRIHQRFPGITTDGGLTFWEGGIFVLSFLHRFVRAQERFADALETIARKLKDGSGS